MGEGKERRPQPAFRWERHQFEQFIEALAARDGDDLLVLTAIKQLTETMEGLFMGLKEDFEALQIRFTGMEEATQLIADDIAALKEEIRVLNENSNIDLSGVLARAESIETRLRGAAGSQPGSDEEPTPEPVS